MRELIAIAFNEIKKLKRQVFLVVGPGRSSTPVNDSGPIRTVQAVLGYNQTKDDIPVMQQYGFASNFPVNSDLILAFIAGDRSNGCVVGNNNQQYMIKNLGDGSVAVYDMYANVILLSTAGVKITSLNLIELDAPNIRINASSSLKYDCDGNGTAYTPTTRTDYVIGSTGSSEPLNPPEIP